MATYLLGVGTTAVLFTVGGTDITSYVKSITISEDFADIDTTGMNSVTKTHSPGLRDDKWEVELFQSFSASTTDPVLYPLLGSTTGATLLFQTSGSTVDTAHPKYTMVGSLFSYQPVSGTVGDSSMTKVTFLPIAGSSTTRATA